MSYVFSLLWGAISAYTIYKIYLEYTNRRSRGVPLFEKPKGFNTNHQIVLISIIFIVYRFINLKNFATSQNLSGLLSLVLILIYFIMASFRKEGLYDQYLTTYRGQYRWPEVQSYHMDRDNETQQLIVELKIVGNNKREEFIEFKINAAKEDFFKDFFKSRIRKQHS